MRRTFRKARHQHKSDIALKEINEEEAKLMKSLDRLDEGIHAHSGDAGKNGLDTMG